MIRRKQHWSSNCTNPVAPLYDLQVTTAQILETRQIKVTYCLNTYYQSMLNSTWDIKDQYIINVKFMGLFQCWAGSECIWQWAMIRNSLTHMTHCLLENYIICLSLMITKALSLYKAIFPGMGITMLKIRRSRDCLIDEQNLSNPHPWSQP